VYYYLFFSHSLSVISFGLLLVADLQWQGPVPLWCLPPNNNNIGLSNPFDIY